MCICLRSLDWRRYRRASEPTGRLGLFGPIMLEQRFFETLARARSGDEHAFALIYNDIQPALLRYSWAQAPGHGEDISAEVWLEVTRSLCRFEGDEQGFRAWVFAIARHKIIDQVRRDARRPTILLGDAGEIYPHEARDVAEDFEDGEATSRALALVRTLPPDQAEVILLRVVGDLDHAQIAGLLGKSRGAVRVLLHRGLRRLAVILSDQMVVGGVDR
jgi:RNA polymerase sigma-70 factor (ECF subfamily)